MNIAKKVAVRRKRAGRKPGDNAWWSIALDLTSASTDFAGAGCHVGPVEDAGSTGGNALLNMQARGSHLTASGDFALSDSQHRMMAIPRLKPHGSAEARQDSALTETKGKS